MSRAQRIQEAGQRLANAKHMAQVIGGRAAQQEVQAATEALQTLARRKGRKS